MFETLSDKTDTEGGITTHGLQAAALAAAGSSRTDLLPRDAAGLTNQNRQFRTY
jgi:hypothetical protein